MFKTRTADPAYGVRITKAILEKWNGEIRVWDAPKSAIEGAKVLDKITQPIQAQVLEEQLDMFGSIPQRARIRYGNGQEGWVIFDMIEKPKGKAASKK
ncbi:MAG: hypothetical protein HY261_10020 [Chloroflexi bacterium]|nr:hypothetical protein [Chloroflexota bacterium]